MNNTTATLYDFTNQGSEILPTEHTEKHGIAWVRRRPVRCIGESVAAVIMAFDILFIFARMSLLPLVPVGIIIFCCTARKKQPGFKRCCLGFCRIAADWALLVRVYRRGLPCQQKNQYD
jgi:hypothetical protein